MPGVTLVKTRCGACWNKTAPCTHAAAMVSRAKQEMRATPRHKSSLLPLPGADCATRNFSQSLAAISRGARRSAKRLEPLSPSGTLASIIRDIRLIALRTQ